jgi:hypothetical protein
MILSFYYSYHLVDSIQKITINKPSLELVQKKGDNNMNSNNKFDVAKKNQMIKTNITSTKEHPKYNLCN